MPPLRGDPLERRLRALDHEAFVAFVAALWRERGWTVDREGAVLQVTREGDDRRVLVLPPRRLLPGRRAAPEWQGSIDAVVSPRRLGASPRLPRGVPETATVHDADDLREQLRYALDDATRRELLDEHLGLDDDAVLEPDRSGGLASRLPSDRLPLGRLPIERLPLDRLPLPRAGGEEGDDRERGRGQPTASGPDGTGESGSRRRVAGLAGLLLVVVGVAVLLGAVSGLPIPGGVEDANATEPGSLDDPVPVESQVYEVSQSCEREPVEIAKVTTEALRGPSLDRGIVTLGQFWNPRHVDGVQGRLWSDMIRGESLTTYAEADRVEIGEATVTEGESATVTATAVDDGERIEYAFRFSWRTASPRSDCWVIDSFGRT